MLLLVICLWSLLTVMDLSYPSFRLQTALLPFFGMIVQPIHRTSLRLHLSNSSYFDIMYSEWNHLPASKSQCVFSNMGFCANKFPGILTHCKEREGRATGCPQSGHLTSLSLWQFFSDMFEAYFGGKLDPLKLPKDDEDSFVNFRWLDCMHLVCCS